MLVIACMAYLNHLQQIQVGLTVRYCMNFFGKKLFSTHFTARDCWNTCGIIIIIWSNDNPTTDIVIYKCFEIWFSIMWHNLCTNSCSLNIVDERAQNFWVKSFIVASHETEGSHPFLLKPFRRPPWSLFSRKLNFQR